MKRPFPSDHRRRRLIGLVALLAAATASATYLQASLSVLAVYLTTDLGISRSQVGIAFAVFSVIGGLAAPLVGVLADRSTRMVMFGLFALSAASVLVTSAASHLAWILVATGIGGLAFAAGNPVTNRLVFEEVSPARHGLAIGIKQTGPPLALLAAGIVIPPLATLIGWRWAFAATAMVPLAGIAASRALVPRLRPRPAGEPPPSPGERASAAFTVRWLTWTSVVFSAGIGAVIAFVPLYAHERLGLSEPAAGMAAALIGLFGVVGRIAWGAGGHRFRGPTAGLTLISLSALVATAMIWSASAAPWLIWPAAAAVGFSMPAWHVVIWVVLLNAVGPSDIGRSTGVVHLGTSVGFAAGPPVMGALVDAAGSYAWGWGLVLSLFATTTLLMLSWRWMASSRPRPERVPAQ